MKITQELINDCNSKSDILRKLGIALNGKNSKKVSDIIILSDIDISHFYKAKYKYPEIEKNCPVCNIVFITQKDHPQEKTTCSCACSNKYFRSNDDHPNWKENSYRTTCFLYHKKECVVCKENRIVEVHHLDCNNTNNNPSNLIPLCPTHHKYWHSRYKDLVEEKVLSYIENWKDKGLIKLK